MIYCIKCVCHAGTSTGISILLALHKVISTKDGSVCVPTCVNSFVLVNERLVWPSWFIQSTILNHSSSNQAMEHQGVPFFLLRN